ncbi:Crp/Fnr family transcriptional regulator [Brevundimonas guildfordensis]|uniref:Helix-turn-helix domain-containing protein n=1 Tax=Brevundimonas guildfordensis TaxID=2762241 RepID=A0ABR8QZ66_9CAUL|nr:helix-turn-helix domain-containing protein [Brevundimonas guildfordensis]MBD7940819.1 helix-turn-helix domain-containing protein [Brevundimonas guildfordensis]
MNTAAAQPPNEQVRLADVHPCANCGARPLGVCADLKGHELQSMACASETVTAQPGQALFHEGDPNPFVFNVVDGAVKLYRLLPDGRRQITGFLFQGDFLGLGGRGASSFTAEALTPLSACRFRRSDFDQLLNALPALEHRLVALAGDELMAAQEQIVLLGRKTARERLASFLTRLAERQVQLGGRKGQLHLPMTRLDIADYLGLTIETVSRVFTQFKTSGLIQLLPGNEVALPDPAALKALGEGAA